jgi:hypothetical protein
MPGRKTEGFCRIEVGKLELLRLVDPAVLDDLGELHRQYVRSLMAKVIVPRSLVPRSLVPRIDEESDHAGDSFGVGRRLPRSGQLRRHFLFRQSRR